MALSDIFKKGRKKRKKEEPLSLTMHAEKLAVHWKLTGMIDFH